MYSEIHQKALLVVSRYKKAEADLIDILQEIDAHRVYLNFECKSLFDYSIKILKLSESIAYNFIVVSKKAKEVPELKRAIAAGKLSVSKARKITTVLTVTNQEEWLKKAVELPQRDLEQEVAKACPREATPEKVKFVSDDRLQLQLGISRALRLKLKRAQDLEAQKNQKSVTLEETLEALLDFYLENQDPVKKAQKLKNRKNLPVARQVDLRDLGQCTSIDALGNRCQERRWLHTHHIIPRSLGGSDAIENLTTLCSGHHRMVHQTMEEKHGRSPAGRTQ